MFNGFGTGYNRRGTRQLIHSDDLLRTDNLVPITAGTATCVLKSRNPAGHPTSTIVEGVCAWPSELGVPLWDLRVEFCECAELDGADGSVVLGWEKREWPSGWEKRVWSPGLEKRPWSSRSEQKKDLLARHVILMIVLCVSTYSRDRSRSRGT